MKTIAFFIAALLLGCATAPVPASHEPPCDRAKVVADWQEWDAEVRAILCREANACGEPDEDVGYGFTVALFHQGLTPCLAAERIIQAASKGQRQL